MKLFNPDLFSDMLLEEIPIYLKATELFSDKDKLVSGVGGSVRPAESPVQ